MSKRRWRRMNWRAFLLESALVFLVVFGCLTILYLVVLAIYQAGGGAR